MLEKLMASPYAWTILSIIAFASFFYAIFCQHKNKEKKEFSFRHRANTVIVKKKSKYEKLFISYDGQQIEDLSVSRFIIWNSGNKTLNSTDMVDSKELTISALGDSIILDSELIAQTEETNKFQIKTIDDHSVKIVFDYVDKKDGIVLQIIHTGTKDDIILDCKIKGGYPIKNTSQKKHQIKDNHKQFFLRAAVIFMVFFTLYFLFIALLCSIAIFNPSLQVFLFNSMNSLLSHQQEAILLSIVSWTYFFMVIRLIIKRFFNFGIPKSLKKYVGFE